MKNKINLAIACVMSNGNTLDAKNDAANIFAASYPEYMAIWSAIENL